MKTKIFRGPNFPVRIIHEYPDLIVEALPVIPGRSIIPLIVKPDLFPDP
jgi:hypothetical protein